MAVTRPRTVGPWAVALTTVVFAGLAIAGWAAFVRPDDRSRTATSASQGRQSLLDPELLAAGVRGEVAVPGLGIAEAPGAAPFARIEEGQGVAIIGQRQRGGASWHLVQARHRAAELFGWIPDLAGGVPTLSPLPAAECRDASLGWIGSVDPPDRLRCWSGQRVSIQGWIIETAAAEAYVGRPEWLASGATLAITVAIGPAIEGPALPIHFPPGIERPPLTPRDGPAPNLQVRIKGHFDDQRAADCVHEPDMVRIPPLDAELSSYWCRQRLVVDRWELVATE